jgi:hypothetical protein
MLAGVETAECETGGLAGAIPVLAGQSTIDELLPGLHGLLAFGVPAAASGSGNEATAGSQPALF